MFAASKTDSASTGGYQISRSLRFNSADSAYLNRTPAGAGNRQIWTYSTWIKRSSLGSSQSILEAASGSADQYSLFFFTSGDLITLVEDQGSGGVYALTTSQVFRDVSAWYHIVIAFDTTQATSSNRIKLYVNGSQVTAFGSASYPAQNLNTYVNAANAHRIGTRVLSNAYINGYETEINLIDGQQLTPSSFGETDTQTGVWKPKAYSGSYGTNGFYLNFSDNSNTTAATLGKDYSGNGNNWTPNNFSVTAGAGNDSLVDSPTSYGTDTGVGGTVRGNYCTFNPLDRNSSLAVTNGNLDVTESGGNWINGRCTIGVSSGKWYFESTITSGSYQVVGIANSLTINTGYSEGSVIGNWAYSTDGAKILNGAYTTPYGASYGLNDVIGVAFDADAGTLTMYKNGTSQGTLVSGLPANTYFPWAAILNATVSFNFGQRPFAYTAPSGFKALCTQNLLTPTIGATTATQAGKFFNPVLYTGNAGTLAVTGVGFQPDFVWAKGRSVAYSHGLFDAVRGATLKLTSNSTNAEATESGLTAFNSDGFTLGSDVGLNSSSATYVSWNWKANGSGSSNTAGSITSTVSASTTSGFSVVTYTGTGSAGATIGHGLGVVPSMIIFKRRNGTTDWQVYHTSLGNAASVYLDLTNSSASSPGMLNSTTPTSTLITLGTSTDTNPSTGTMVAYCFAPIAGYSAFGTYTGNGSTDGPFVYTGFRPAFVIIKNTTNAQDWMMFDSARNTYNATNLYLQPNQSSAEASGIGDATDFLSNGFKIKSTNGTVNTSTQVYIFMCFASNPFKYSLAR
jgi:hypothetical protein